MASCACLPLGTCLGFFGVSLGLCALVGAHFAGKSGGAVEGAMVPAVLAIVLGGAGIAIAVVASPYGW